MLLMLPILHMDIRIGNIWYFVNTILPRPYIFSPETGQLKMCTSFYRNKIMNSRSNSLVNSVERYLLTSIQHDAKNVEHLMFNVLSIGERGLIKHVM